MIAGGGIAMGITYVVGFGASILGTMGTAMEAGVKNIDKDQRPVAKTIGEVFSKTIQNGSAAFLLVIGGSLMSNPILFSALGIGVMMASTPIFNEIIQVNGNESFKKVMGIADKVTNIASKMINSIVITTGVFMSCDFLAAVLFGIGVGSLNMMAYRS